VPTPRVEGARVSPRARRRARGRGGVARWGGGSVPRHDGWGTHVGGGRSRVRRGGTDDAAHGAPAGVRSTQRPQRRLGPPRPNHNWRRRMHAVWIRGGKRRARRRIAAAGGISCAWRRHAHRWAGMHPRSRVCALAGAVLPAGAARRCRHALFPPAVTPPTPPVAEPPPSKPPCPLPAVDAPPTAVQCACPRSAARRPRVPLRPPCPSRRVGGTRLKEPSLRPVCSVVVAGRAAVPSVSVAAAAAVAAARFARCGGRFAGRYRCYRVVGLCSTSPKRPCAGKRRPYNCTGL